MTHKAWSRLEEVPYCFSRSYVKLQGHTAKKNRRFWPKLAVSGLKLQFEFTNCYEMMHKTWSNIEEMPYCFSRSYIKLQGHTALEIVEFEPDWVFPDCNSSLNSAMAPKWCTKLEVALKMPYCFSRSFVKFQGHTILKVAEFDPNWACPDSNSSFNTPIATKWCIKLEVA